MMLSLGEFLLDTLAMIAGGLVFVFIGWVALKIKPLTPDETERTRELEEARRFRNYTEY